MRWAWILALIFTGCGLIGCGAKVKQTHLPSYQHARELLKSEHVAEASAETHRALAHATSKGYWNLRLLEAEILLAQREAKQAQETLNFSLPSGSDYAEQAARYHLCKAHAILLLTHIDEARAELDKAEALAPPSAKELLAE